MMEMKATMVFGGGPGYGHLLDTQYNGFYDEESIQKVGIKHVGQKQGTGN